jgi:hypothetical protein
MTSETLSSGTEVSWISRPEFYEAVCGIYFVVGLLGGRDATTWGDVVIPFFCVAMGTWYTVKMRRSLKTTSCGNF